METTLKRTAGLSLHRIGGAAFVTGNLLFLLNKVNEMSRLFLGKFLPDLISGEDRLLIAFGQAALLIGYYAFYKSYHPAGRFARTSFRVFLLGGAIMAFGHAAFMNGTPGFLFTLVLLGGLLMIPGLVFFGIANLRNPVLSPVKWLPLFTGLMGFAGFFLFSGEVITATFLFFRTLFALGLVGMGLALWLDEK